MGHGDDAVESLLVEQTWPLYQIELQWGHGDDAVES